MGTISSDKLAAIFKKIEHDLMAGSPPELTREKRAETLPVSAIEKIAAAIVAEAKLPKLRWELLTGLALLWHDHWNAAHEVAQAEEGRPEFDFLHALCHRREGDYGNSSYWLGSAGKHPSYPHIGSRLRESFAKDDSMPNALLRNGIWSPSDFLAEVRAFQQGNKTGKPEEKKAALMKIQAVEMRAFAEWLVSQN